jgi:predicted site-specific integrase-resolvase
MVSPDEAAALVQASPRIIYRWVEAGVVHFTETPEGLLICLDSLRSGTSRTSSNEEP